MIYTLVSLVYLLYGSIHVSCNTLDEKSFSKLSNNCVGKTDGEYWLQLSDESSDYVPVHIKCSNGFMIIDVSKDNSLVDYFSSFEDWHYQMSGPSTSNPVTWEEWFLPLQNNNESEYLLSPDCNVCNDKLAIQIYDKKSTYWMSGNLAKIYWAVFGFSECDMDAQTYLCQDCSDCELEDPCLPTPVSTIVNGEETFQITDFGNTGTCANSVLAANSQVYTDRQHAQSLATLPHYKPSIGTFGQFCVCYKPSIKLRNEFTLTKSQLAVIKNKMDNNKNSDNVNNKDASYQSTKSQKLGEKNQLLTSLFENGLGIDGYRPVENDELSVKIIDKRKTNVIYLSQEDFLSGTYRIVESGTYILSEDITLDFENNNNYWPRMDQSDIYPGAGGYRDAYNLGFFAGITIETNYVTIDLNSHELKQSYSFYYEQRWFALIELSNQQFLPGQGPSFFGANAINVNDITIKNGILGLTSHFAIHGNFAKNLLITNVHIKDFVTHGVQLNGYDGVIFENVEIGPSSEIEYIRGHYGHGRVILERLRVIEEKMDEEGTIFTNKIKFSHRDRELTITDIADQLENELKYCKHYAMNKISNKFSDTDYIDPNWLITQDDKDLWTKAKNTYIHENGIPSASGIVGIFLNFDSASVNTYAKYTLPEHQSKKAIIKNVWIHDISHDFQESHSLGNPERSVFYTNPFFTAVNSEMCFGGEKNLRKWHNSVVVPVEAGVDASLTPINEFHYVGNSLTDSYFAMWKLSDDWDLLGQLSLTQKYNDTNLASYAFGDISASPYWRVQCNMDSMSHSGKGILGIRIDGSRDIKISNLKISNLYEYTPIGSTACGEYDAAMTDGGGGHFRQRLPQQRGFSGNNIQGIAISSSQGVVFENDIILNNFHNDFSKIYGISVWTANTITIHDSAKFLISNFYSGKNLKFGTFSYDDLPNSAPETCAFRYEGDDTSDYAEYFVSKIQFPEKTPDTQIVLSCSMFGHTYCLGDDDKQTMWGTYLGDNSELCNNEASISDAGFSYSTRSLNNDNKGLYGGLIQFVSGMNGVTGEIMLIVATGVLLAFLLVYFCCNSKQSQNKMVQNNSDGTIAIESYYGSI